MSGPEHDVWSGARARAREEVRAAFAPQKRVCRACGHEEETAARACPRCGTPYVEMQEPGLSRRQRRRLALGAAAVLLVLVAAAIAIVPTLQSEKRSSGARQRAADAAALARERHRIALDQRPHTRTAARRGTSLRAALETAITADARSRVRAGTLRGPIVRTDCTAVRGTPGAYTCEAVNEEILRGSGQQAGTLGYPFWARVDAARRTFTWCKVNPQAGEGSATPGATALIVPVPRGCDITR